MGGLAGLLVLLPVALLLAVVVLSAIVCRDVLRPPRHTAGYAAARGLAFDPGEAGLGYESWTLDRPGGSLPVWEIEGRKTGAPRLTSAAAVFVHDWGESRIDVLGRLGPWPRLCARLILYDRPGHGEAGGGALRRGEWSDLLALLEAAGPGRYLLVGRGTGANLAIAAAARCQPGKALGVVAERPVPGSGPWLRERLRRAGQALWPLGDLACWWLAAFGAGIGNTRADAGRLRCPLLVVDAAGGRAIAAAAKSAVVVPEETDDVLQEFIRSCTGPLAEKSSPATAQPPAPSVPLADEIVHFAVIAYRHARRVVVIVVGVSVVLVGLAMVVLPGPAFIVIPLGLAILGIEFAWARLWLKKIKQAAKNAGKLVTGGK